MADAANLSPEEKAALEAELTGQKILARLATLESEYAEQAATQEDAFWARIEAVTQERAQFQAQVEERAGTA